MVAYQCPRCELKFSFRTEVAHHFANDHRPVKPTEHPDNSSDGTNIDVATRTAVTTPEPVPRRTG